MEEAEHLAGRIVVLDSGSVIARARARELKEQIGGDMVDRVSDPVDLERAAQVLSQLAGGAPHVDINERVVQVPTRLGTAMLLEAGRQLVEAQIGLDDLGIRRPSLDDVFLTLTRPAGPPQPVAEILPVLEGTGAAQ